MKKFVSQKKTLKNPSAKKRKKKPAKSLLRKTQKRLKSIKNKKLRKKNVSKPSLVSDEDQNLPAHYNEDKVVLLVRDPWWIYAYWEGKKFQGDWVLRVYDVTDSSLPQAPFFDIEPRGADNWYIDVAKPGHEWIAQAGTRDSKKGFLALVTSNRVRTPDFGLSGEESELSRFLLEWFLKAWRAGSSASLLPA